MEIFHFDNIFVDYLFRIVLSLACGLFLGIERKIRKNAVGIRTLVLISVSSCLLSILSSYMADIYPARTDASRISAAVVTGIGFLGGGAIFRQGLNIRGLTTAAIIWAVSALGLACGAGLYYPALITLATILLMLIVMNTLEHRMFPVDRTKNLSLEFDCVDIDEKTIREILISYGLIVYDLDITHSIKKDRIELLYSLKAPDTLNSIKLSTEIAALGHLVKFTLSD